jgi:hypothetical protein
MKGRDLDNRRIRSQSCYFDKEEIIGKMTQFHDEMLKRMGHVGHSGYTALRRERSSSTDDASFQVSTGGYKNASMPVILLLPWSSEIRGTFNSFILQVVKLCRVFLRDLFFQKRLLLLY